MSIEWLVKNFNANAVILIRHPAAFIASLKAKNWSHDFDHFIQQEKLMAILGPYADQIILYTQEKPDIIDQGILLWNILYSRVMHYNTQYPDWIYIRHEDLSRNPVQVIKETYGKLDLIFTEKIEKKSLNQQHLK